MEVRVDEMIGRGNNGLTISMETWRCRLPGWKNKLDLKHSLKFLNQAFSFRIRMEFSPCKPNNHVWELQLCTAHFITGKNSISHHTEAINIGQNWTGLLSAGPACELYSRLQTYKLEPSFWKLLRFPTDEFYW
ncbi:hypothetical protein LSTR_LSTR000907 [Laodelphax striatellus]|uniref:Uncharacterized protein n=1 Tax=Laodelphax striatellus TaxID=195883 RepID=A0A482X1D9_LAOST|nr:hypothetical protein LSTR_LSTR000907 [Laodelphax striatellus]